MKVNNYPKLIFIDRDGVILKHVEPYILHKEEISFVPGSDFALKQIAELGIRMAVVSNQSPVSRGLIKESFVEEVNDWIRNNVQLKENILKFYYCPHVDKDDCNCRKPKTGMLFQAGNDFNMDIEDTWMIGDADTDMLAGKKAHVKKCIHVLSGRQKKNSPFADCEYMDLREVVEKELFVLRENEN